MRFGPQRSGALPSVVLPGLGVAHEGVEGGQDVSLVGVGQRAEGLETLGHGLVADGVGGSVAVIQVVHGDAEDLGELGDDVDGGRHLAAFVAADHGGAGADLLGQLGLRPATIPAEVVDLAGEGGERGGGGRHVVSGLLWSWIGATGPRMEPHRAGAIR